MLYLEQPSNTLLYVYTFLFIHLPIDGHLGCAQLSALVIATLNLAIDCLLLLTLGMLLEVEYLDHTVILFLTSFKLNLL